MWWSPDPRMILHTDKFKVSKSFKAFLKKINYKVTFNKDFKFVINSCANIKRINQKGTWITEGLIKSFIDLHKMGKAMSVEVWVDDEIVGGLYGLDLDDIFCGESMFSKSSNASKIALYYLTNELKKNNYRFIDCQVPSEHLKSLGGEVISRSNFLDLL
jgi:leucyl/phenylalanyl-tRNA--protein transferase